MTNKPTTLQWAGIGGFLAVIASTFLPYNNPEYHDGESLFTSLTTPSSEGGLGLAVWIYVFFALALLGAWMVYDAKQKSVALLLAGIVTGFVAFFLVFNDIADGGVGLGLVLSVIGALVASIAAIMMMKKDA